MADRGFGSDQELVDACNDMLSRMHVASRVRHWSEINANVFVMLYEGVCGEPLLDKIVDARSREDEVHNCQAVIDSLSLDVLNTTLSHIIGDDVVNGNKTAIGNLLGVFQGLMEYLLDKIESSIDHDEIHNGTVHSEDPDMVTADVIDSILERELGNSRSRNGNQLKVSWEDTNGRGRTDLSSSYRMSNLSGQDSRQDGGGRIDDTAELIRLGNSEYSQYLDSKMSRNSSAAQAPAPTVPQSRLRETYPSGQAHAINGSRDPLSLSTGDLNSYRDINYSGYAGDNSGLHNSTVELIKESEEIRKRIERADQDRLRTDKYSSGVPDTSLTSSVALPEPVAAGSSSGQFDQLGMRPRVDDPKQMSASFREADPLSASLPIAPVSSFASLVNHQSQANSKTNASSRQLDGRASEPDPAVLLNGGYERYRDERHASTAPNLKSHPYSSGIVDKSRSFENLQTMMHDTVAMSRDALTGSPLSKRKTYPSATGRRDDDIDEELSEALRSSVHLRGKTSIENSYNSRATSADEPKLQSILSPTKKSSRDNDFRRKVSFKTGKKSRGGKPSPPEKVTSSRTMPDYSRKDAVSSPANKRPPRVHKKVRSEDEEKKAIFEKQSDLLAETFHDYLMKYYGQDHRQQADPASESDGDGYQSDGNVNYNNRNKPSDIATEMERARDELHKKARNIRFDDILDDSAPGRMGSIRRKLKDEDINSRFKAEYLNKVYEDELMDYEEEVNDYLTKPRKAASDKDKEYKKKVLSAPKTSKYKPPKKYSGSVLIARPSRQRAKPTSKGRKRSASASPTIIRTAPKSIYDNEILPWLLEEFPFLHLSSETLQDLWRKSAGQIEQLSKAEKALNNKKTKAQLQVEDSERRQKILLDIMRKELGHNQRLKDIKERQRLAQSVKNKMKEKRQQSARCRKYYDEYQVRMRGKMLKKRNKEELIFKKLFNDGLDIQKERIRELRKYAKEQRDVRASKQQNDLESLENYYRDQFSMLGDAMKQEKNELDVREKAQDKVMQQMKKELRKKMETEIKTFQEQLYRDEDDAYWRDLDAERLRHELHVAKYKTKV